MPALTCNIEGLKLHNLLMVFVDEPHLTPTSRKWRGWLVHCLAKAGRHYNEARNTILMQIDEGKRSPEQMSQGRLMPILDFSLAMEDCLTSIYKAANCIMQLRAEAPYFEAFCIDQASAVEQLSRVRNQQEHMDKQVASGQTGDGPLVLAVDDSGDGMQFRNLKLSFSAVHSLVEGLFRTLAALYPNFDPASPPRAQGTTTIRSTLSETVVPGTPQSTPGSDP